MAHTSQVKIDTNYEVKIYGITSESDIPQALRDVAESIEEDYWSREPEGGGGGGGRWG